MEYSKSVEAKQGTKLVLSKSIHEDTMKYSIHVPIQAEEDVINSMLVASVKPLNITR